MISREEVKKIINNNTFLDNYNVAKILPSKLLISINKTEFIGNTILDGKNFYIGKNGKLTEMFLVEKEYNLPQVFGNFQVSEFLKLQDIQKTISDHKFTFLEIEENDFCLMIKQYFEAERPINKIEYINNRTKCNNFKFIFIKRNF